MAWIWILFAAFSVVTPTPAMAFGQQSMAMSQQQAAITRQKTSIRQQAERLSLWMVPWTVGPPLSPEGIAQAPCAPIADDIVAPLIEGAAKSEALEPKLIRAVIEQESGFRPCAVSAKGAQGLMQLMPETAQELQVADPFEPGQNVKAGAKYLKRLLAKYHGDVAQALAAYNAGPNVVDQSGGIPDIPETREYVSAILEKLGIKSSDGSK